MDFTGGPTVGEPFTVMTATTINGSFAHYQTNMKSVFGQIIYLSQSIQFKVIANDVIFIDGTPSCVARCASQVRSIRLLYATAFFFIAFSKSRRCVFIAVTYCATPAANAAVVSPRRNPPVVSAFSMRWISSKSCSSR
jgi:hypothetical protein